MARIKYYFLFLLLIVPKILFCQTPVYDKMHDKKIDDHSATDGLQMIELYTRRYFEQETKEAQRKVRQLKYKIEAGLKNVEDILNLSLSDLTKDFERIDNVLSLSEDFMDLDVLKVYNNEAFSHQKALNIYQNINSYNSNTSFPSQAQKGNAAINRIHVEEMVQERQVLIAGSYEKLAKEYSLKLSELEGALKEDELLRMTQGERFEIATQIQNGYKYINSLQQQSEKLLKSSMEMSNSKKAAINIYKQKLIRVELSKDQLYIHGTN
ncbi:hypothetical protein [Chondrinema litorale]|uniref:hypothetical protein n=1 Tax=Chondrinema litorale TaxID=2994555 RepID=UPI0025434D9A|nr:hypothetical protein [Chondrinema litorale]UZS00069.1 hypothetical protein OQ292_39710 [Chondrinema litorale]